MYVNSSNLDGLEQPYEVEIRRYPATAEDYWDYFEVVLRDEYRPVGYTVSCTAAYGRYTEPIDPEDLEGSHVDLPIKRFIVLPDHGTEEVRVEFITDDRIADEYDEPIEVVRMDHEEAEQKGYRRPEPSA